MKHPPDGGDDGQLLHEIYQFAQKELSQLKDKVLKTGRGSVNHPLTNQKITRSKNPTRYSEWDNTKGKTLSYVLETYQTRQLMWARNFFRHHIDSFKAKCQDNKSQIPSGIPLDPSGLAILGTSDACHDWLKQCEQYINWKSKSLLQPCIKAKIHPQPEADDRVSDILQDIQSRDTPQPRNRSKYLMRCDLVYRLVYEKLSQREREYQPNGQRREKRITFAECMKRVYQRWDQGSFKELEENLRWHEENPITNKESIVDDGLEPVGQSGRLMKNTSSDEVSLEEKASLWASVYYQLASPADPKKPFLEICAAGTYLLRSKEEIVIMEGGGSEIIKWLNGTYSSTDRHIERPRKVQVNESLPDYDNHRRRTLLAWNKETRVMWEYSIRSGFAFEFSKHFPKLAELANEKLRQQEGVEFLLEFLSKLISEPRVRDWLIEWNAFMIQYPSRRPQSYILLHSDIRGCGKNVLTSILQ